MALVAEDPASCACSNVPMTWLLRLPDVLPVRLLTAEPIAPEMDGVKLANEDSLVLVLAPGSGARRRRLRTAQFRQQRKGLAQQTHGNSADIGKRHNCSFDMYEQSLGEAFESPQST
jgi:hypothetical protein